MERQTIKVYELARYLGVSKDLVYRLAKEGEIPSVKIGSRVLFRKEAVDRWLDQKEI